MAVEPLIEKATSAAAQFVEKCRLALEENKNLILQKINDPSSLVNIDVSGALIDAIRDGQLKDLGIDLLKQNADRLILAAAKATGLETKLQEAIDLAFNIMSSAMAAYNDLALIYVKKIAQNILVALDDKEVAIAGLREHITAIYNILLSLSEGNPVIDEYLDDLRAALIALDSAQLKLRQVSGSLQTRDFFLARTFQSAQDDLATADQLIVPLIDTEIDTDALLQSIGVPTTDEQINNIVQLPRRVKKMILSARDYVAALTTVNVLLDAYTAALNSLTSNFPEILKRYTLSMFDTIDGDITNLKENMASVLNGSTTAIEGPLVGFEPTPLLATTFSYKWALDLNLILEFVKFIPAEELTQLTLSSEPVRVYEETITDLSFLDTVTSGSTILTAENGKESLTELESLLFTYGTGAMGAIVPATIDNSLLSLGRSILARFDLVEERDTEIRAILQRFIDTPIPLEDVLRQLEESLATLFEELGLDRAAALLEGGAFQEFFNLNGNTATYAGAGLVAIGLLKNCFDNDADRARLNNVQRELERDQSLINIKVSFDFDFAILRNLEECVRLNNLANIFGVQELICAIVDSLPSSQLDTLEDIVSFFPGE
jgi:hypothetical protein